MSKSNTIVIENNLVRKITEIPWAREDYEVYKKFSHRKPYLPKIDRWITKNEYTMEKLDILCTIQEGLLFPKKYNLNKDVILTIPAMYNQIFVDCLNFSRLHYTKEKAFYMHRDLHLKNVVITTDYKIMVIDVDAFEKTYTMVPWRYLNNHVTVLWMANEALVHV